MQNKLTKERLLILLYNAIVILEELNVDLTNELGLATEEYNQIMEEE